MRRSQSIMCVIHALRDVSRALEQALIEARSNEAALCAIAVCPALPRELAEYRVTYEASLLERVKLSIATARRALGMGPDEVPVKVELECSDAPAVEIVRRMIRSEHDLLIKDADPDRSKGFRSFDMQLLRLCPAPVWLCRPMPGSRSSVQVAVAVNPGSQERAGWHLALRLLQLARSLADTHSGELKIISCWGFEAEADLRHSPWIRMSEAAIGDAVATAERRHRDALERLLRQSGIAGAASVHIERGRPDSVLPRLVQSLGIDLLVMGTVGRTGVPGFLIGNTAENVLGEIQCSLLAAKPNGFVSPVRAYE